MEHVNATAVSLYVVPQFSSLAVNEARPDLETLTLELAHEVPELARWLEPCLAFGPFGIATLIALLLVRVLK